MGDKVFITTTCCRIRLIFLSKLSFEKIWSSWVSYIKFIIYEYHTMMGTSKYE